MLTLLLTALTFAAEPQLPAVEKAVPPVYPSAALAQGEGAVVTLQLDLDAQGRVVNVAVIGSAGPDFDAAAKDALRAYTFRPAYDTEGVAVAARIQYALRFEAAKAAPLSVEGTLLEGGTRQPLAEVELRILGPGGEQRSTRSDAEGRFRFAGLPEGAWTITASGPGLETETAELQVREGSVASARLYVARTRTWERTDEELVVEAEARGSEVTERVLNPEEVRYLPGTQGDLVRVVQNLPGVARPPLNIGQLIIRGTAPEDSSTFLDGARIPIVFHFSGFSTVLAADLIEEVAYLPGNWSVRYGRSLGGVVDLRTEEDLPERSTGYASVDLIQTQVFVDQRISEDAAITFAARRSYVDAILNPIFSKIPGVSVRAPRYWDVQLRARDELEDGQRLDLLYVGSDDRFEFVGESEEGSGVQVGLSTFFHKGRLRWTAPLPADWEHELTLSGGPEEQNFQFAVDGLAYEKAIVMGMREELMRPASPERWGWRAGLDAEWAWEAYLYDVEGFGSSEQGDGFRANPAFYVEPTAIYGRWTLIPGMRVEIRALPRATPRPTA
jgi:TonB family protein